MAGNPKWEKGVSGNPAGRPKASPELKQFRAMSKEDVARMISKYGIMNREDLDAFLMRRDVPVIDQTIASIYQKALDGGDFARMAFLLDRTIGKVTSEVVVTQKLRAEVEAMTDEQLIEAAKVKLLPEGTP